MIYWSSTNKLHEPDYEFDGQTLKPYPENSKRIDNIITRCLEVDLEIQSPLEFDIKWVNKIHDDNYVDFIQQLPKDLEPITPTAFNTTGQIVADSSIFAKLGHYFFDPATPVMGGTASAALSSVNCALNVAKELTSGQETAAGLCRPPGHHAMTSQGGGYCIFNNIAIATEYLREKDYSVAILDLDYHHGNGTQQIFYHRDDVQYVSIHATPSSNYPFYWGHTTETGAEDGIGHTHNIPVPNTISPQGYVDKLKEAITIIEEYNPNIVLVSMGFDCHIDDPVAGLSLQNKHYTTIGNYLDEFDKIGIILEGGYAIEQLGDCFVNLYNQLQK